MINIKYNNIKLEKSQVEIEIKKKFLPKKKQNLLLSESYERISANSASDEDVIKFIKKSAKVADCGTFLEFGLTHQNEFKLHNANFCRDRLCPMCSWRRSYKIFGQVSEIMDVIENDYAFLFLTLTVPSVYNYDLPKKLDEMQKGFKMLSKNKLFKKVVKGYFRALEVTHDINDRITEKMYYNPKKKAYYDNLGLKVGDINPNFNKYHPHYHIILAVPKDYFKHYYITHDEWLQMWRDAINDQSITQVYIEVCKPKHKKKLSKNEMIAFKSLSAAVSEVAKYSVKSSDYIIKGNPEMTDISVKDLSTSLHNRKLCTMGGIFKEVSHNLKIDLEDKDLIHVGKLRTDIFIQIYRYEWTAGAYKLTEVIDIDNSESA